MTDEEKDTDKEKEPTLKVEVTNQPIEKEIPDTTSWEEEDPWDDMAMSDNDIKEAEESRNA